MDANQARKRSKEAKARKAETEAKRRAEQAKQDEAWAINNFKPSVATLRERIETASDKGYSQANLAFPVPEQSQAGALLISKLQAHFEGLGFDVGWTQLARPFDYNDPRYLFTVSWGDS